MVSQQLTVEDMLVMGSLRGHPGFDMLLTVLQGREDDILASLQNPEILEKEALGLLALWRAYRQVLGVIAGIFSEADGYQEQLVSLDIKTTQVPESNPHKILEELQSLNNYNLGDE